MSNPPVGPPPAGFPPYPSYPPPGWSPVPADPLIATDFGGWFNRLFGVVRRSFWRLSLITLIAGGIMGLVVGTGIAASSAAGAFHPDTAPGSTTAYTVDTVGSVIMMLCILVAVLAAMVGQGASIHLAVTDAAGRHATIADALRVGLRRVLPLAGWTLLTGVVAILGFFLLVIPGIYLMTVFNASLACVVVIERTDATRCFDLISGRFWATLGRLLLGWLVTQMIPYVAIIPVALLGGLVSSISPGVAGTIAWSVTSVVMVAAFIFPYFVLSTAITVVTYAELRGHDDRFTSVQTLADELARP